SNIDLENPYLKIELSEMISSLPKTLTKKNIIQSKTQNEIQRAITQNTIELLKPCIDDLRKGLIEIIDILNKDIEKKFNYYEKDIHSQIKLLISFEIDNTLIQQLQETNHKLKAQL